MTSISGFSMSIHDMECVPAYTGTYNTRERERDGGREGEREGEGEGEGKIERVSFHEHNTSKDIPNLSFSF